MIRLFREIQCQIATKMNKFSDAQFEQYRKVQNGQDLNSEVASISPEEALSYGDYREATQVLFKLIDIIELFYDINVEMLNSEKRRKSTSRKGVWKSSGIFRRCNNLAGEFLGLLKEIQLVTLNTPQHVRVNMYDHFRKEEDAIRTESDTFKYEENYKKTRVLKMVFPHFVRTAENLEKVSRLQEVAVEYSTLAEKSIRPLSRPFSCCCTRKRMNCWVLFTPLFGDPKQMGKVLAKTFDGEHKWIHTKNGVKIDAMFFASRDEKDPDPQAFKSRPTFILCNPNAMFYQHMINYPHAFYLRFFLTKGINVLLWNYRGYGRTRIKSKRCQSLLKNQPSPHNLAEDAEEVLNYVRKVIGVTGKLGVYGRSLGGIPAAYLSEFVDCVIVDRSFANLFDVIDRKFFGQRALLVYRLSTFFNHSWRAYNDTNFINRGLHSIERQSMIEDKGLAAALVADEGNQSKNCYKLVTCDVNDEIIELQSSLMVGVAKQICLKQQRETDHYRNKPIGILSESECTVLMRAVKRIQEIEFYLFQFISERLAFELTQSDQKEKFINFKKIALEVSQHPEAKAATENRDSDHTELKFVKEADSEAGLSEKPWPKSSGHKVQDEFTALAANKKSLRFTSEQHSQTKKALIRVMGNLVKKLDFEVLERYGENGETSYWAINPDLISLQCGLSKLLSETLNLRAANVYLRDILNFNKTTVPAELQNFFILMEVYGHCTPLSYFETSVQSLGHQRRHSQKDLISLKLRLNDILDNLQKNVSHANGDLTKVIALVETVAHLFGKVTTYFAFKKERIVHQSVATVVEEEPDGRVCPLFATLDEPGEHQVGYLLNLNCGHTQRPSDLEVVLLSNHLENAGFVKKDQVSFLGRPVSISQSLGKDSAKGSTISASKQDTLPPIKMPKAESVQLRSKTYKSSPSNLRESVKFNLVVDVVERTPQEDLSQNAFKTLSHDKECRRQTEESNCSDPQIIIGPKNLVHQKSASVDASEKVPFFHVGVTEEVDDKGENTNTPNLSLNKDEHV